MNITSRGGLCAFFLVLSSLPLPARDIPEPIEAVDPFYGEAKTSFLPSSYFMIRYDNFAIKESDTDSFHMSVLGAFTLYRDGDAAALKLYYGAHLLVGPLLPGDEAASVAEWWMNSIQFQYGFTAGTSLGKGRVFAEYSRASDHPLRQKLNEEKSLENPAFERIALGAVLPPAASGPWTLKSYVRGGFIDLFDYWQADDIPEPATLWFFRLGGEIVFAAGCSGQPYVGGSYDVLVLRSGAVGSSSRIEFGVTFRSSAAKLSLYVVGFHYEDTEEIVDRKQAVQAWGFGFRLNT